MKHEPQSNRAGASFQRHPPLRGTTIIAACLLITFYAIAVGAQSGRRSPKAPGSTPKATPEPEATAKGRSTEKPKVSITLGINGNAMFGDVPLYFYDSILASCADRLHDAPSVELNVSGRNLNRGEAIRLAKSQKEGYVALLELRTDAMRAVQSSGDDLYLEFAVFAPETAKIVTSGRAYQRVYKNKGVIMSPRTSGRTSAVYTEQLLKQAARDAADRILSALHLVLPEGTVPRSY